MNWQYVDAAKKVVFRHLAGGGLESRSIEDAEVAAWLAEGNTPEPAQEPEPLTQRQLDELRYQKRASVKDQLIAYMAADNMQRVRNGEWTVQDLTSLMQDPALQAAQGFMQTLSFELAAQAISQSEHVLMTEEIKSNWINKLQENFYLIP